MNRVSRQNVMEWWQGESYMCRHPELVVEPWAAPLQQRGVKCLAPGPFHGGCWGTAVCDTFSARSLPAGIRIQNSNMVAKLLCSHCNTQLICNIYGPSHSPACYFSTTLCKRAQTDTLCSFYIVYISISVSLNTDWYFYSSRTLSRGWAGHLMLLL